MKVIFSIDQNALIADGHEAPNSTVVLDIPVDQIPESTRKAIAGYWDPATGKIECHYINSRPVNVWVDRLTVPPSVEAGIACLDAFAAKLAAKQEAFAAEERCKSESIATVIRERRTKRSSHRDGYPCLVPDWEWGAAGTVPADWAAELAAQNAQLRAEWEAAKAAEEQAKLEQERAIQRILDGNTLSRYMAGMLPEEELEANLNGFVFAGWEIVPGDLACDDRGAKLPLDAANWKTYCDLQKLGVVEEIREYDNGYGFLVNALRDGVTHTAEVAASRFWETEGDEDE